MGDAVTRGRGDAEIGRRGDEGTRRPFTDMRKKVIQSEKFRVSVSTASPSLRVPASPCLRVPASPCLRVAASPCLRISASPCLRVAASPCLRISASPCLRVPASPCLRVPTSPYLRVPTSPCLRVPASPSALCCLPPVRLGLSSGHAGSATDETISFDSRFLAMACRRVPL